jgi:hypothetical protein
MNKLSVGVPWIVAAAAMLMIVGSAPAALAGDTELVAHVPFAFVVGNSVLPAGDYTVSRESNDASVLAISSTDRKQFVNTLTIPTSSEESADQSALVFDKVGDQYFLARVMPAGSEERDILLKPAALEREVSVDLPVR